MRVNVTYSVELEEVKQILQEILLKVEGSVADINNNFLLAQKSINEDKEKEAVKHIDACRKGMTMLDHSLFDCKNILNGYQQTMLHLSGDQQQIKSGTNEDYDVESR